MVLMVAWCLWGFLQSTSSASDESVLQLFDAINPPPNRLISVTWQGAVFQPTLQTLSALLCAPFD